MTTKNRVYIDYFQSPIGTIELTASDKGVTSLYFKNSHHKVNRCDLLDKVKVQLTEYFNGKRKAFDVALDLQGTSFQQQVWQQLLNVGFGKTDSYGSLAQKLNNPKAVRAVGAANGKNPVSIIVPCHRIIGSNGKLTGYAGGLDRKEWLLKHEGVI